MQVVEKGKHFLLKIKYNYYFYSATKGLIVKRELQNWSNYQCRYEHFCGIH